MTDRRTLLLAVSLTAFLPPASAWAEPCCGPVTPAGERLLARLNASGVDHLWQPRVHVVWDTGEPDPMASRSGSGLPSTHCSSFAAAFAKTLNVYMLRPPDHPQGLLANAQMHWFAVSGPAQGWRPLPDATSAQRSANQGNLVVALVENPDPAKAGHIAIVRPGTPDPATLAAQGPDVTQAGGTNAISIPLARGFHHHPGAWPSAVRFFEHSIGA
jgi:hypothetical protein